MKQSLSLWLFITTSVASTKVPNQFSRKLLLFSDLFEAVSQKYTGKVYGIRFNCFMSECRLVTLIKMYICRDEFLFRRVCTYFFKYKNTKLFACAKISQLRRFSKTVSEDLQSISFWIHSSRRSGKNFVGFATASLITCEFVRPRQQTRTHRVSYRRIRYAPDADADTQTM